MLSAGSAATRQGMRPHTRRPPSLRDVSKSANTQARRDEELAFLVLERVLGVDIKLADAGGGEKMPDGAWQLQTGAGKGIVEVTAPPDSKQMAEWARARRDGCPEKEGCIAEHRDIREFLEETIESDWAQENICKLLAQPADERHLYLRALSYRRQIDFYRLSDINEKGSTEERPDLKMPDGITDLWFEGRASRGAITGDAKIQVARFHFRKGWTTYTVPVPEQQLPPPAGVADDGVPQGWRRPKDRHM